MSRTRVVARERWAYVRRVLRVALAWTLGAAVLAAAGSARAAPPPFYVKVATRSLVGGQLYGPEGEIAELPGEVQDHQLRIYGQLAIDPDWTLVASLTPVGYGRWSSAGRELAYFGGGELGVRRRLLDAEFRLSVEAAAGAQPDSGDLFAAPGADVDVTLGPRRDLEPVARPVVGTAKGRFHLHLERGHPWGWVKLSAGAQVFSAEALEPALDAFVQLGFVLGPVYLDAHFTGWYAVGELAEVRPRGGGAVSVGPINVLGAGQTRYLGFGLGLEWWALEQAALTLGADGAFLARNNLASPALSVGLAIRGP